MGLAPRKFLLRRYSKPTIFSETKQYLVSLSNTTMYNFFSQNTNVAAICKHCVETNEIWFL